MADQRVGRIQNVAAAAVVFFQLDLVAHLELTHKVGHIAHAGTAKCINALVVVTHGQHAAGGVEGGIIHRPLRACAGEHLDPGVLQLVGVLKLVNQDVAKAALVMLTYRVVVAQHLKTAQHQLAKVHHAFALALVFVELVNFCLLARLFVAHFHLVRAQAVFFAARDEVLGLLGRIALVVNGELLVQPFDGRELVLRVQNLKALRQVSQLEVGAQKPVAQAVKSANPHAPHVDRQHA